MYVGQRLKNGDVILMVKEDGDMCVFLAINISGMFYTAFSLNDFDEIIEIIECKDINIAIDFFNER